MTRRIFRCLTRPLLELAFRCGVMAVAIPGLERTFLAGACGLIASATAIAGASAPGLFRSISDLKRARVLVVTGGHDFDAAGFAAMFQKMQGISYEIVTFGRGAEDRLNRQGASDYDAVVFYDMHQDPEPHRRGMLDLLAQGKGMVFLHHSLWSYDGTWDDYSQIVGGRASSKVKVASGSPSISTYEHGEHVHVHLADPSHPIVRGLRDFDIIDETYNHYWVDPAAHVLLTTDNPTSEQVIAWSHRYDKSRIVYIELGHGPTAYENPNYITLVRQAILWVAGGNSGLRTSR